MGGLKVMPDLPLSAFVPESADILILPGGESWTNGEVAQVSEAVRAMVTLSRPVAAICAATLALAHGGLLDEHLHTSNGKNFIGKYVRNYRGEEFYRASPAVHDRCVITANGLAPFAFAAEIFRALALNENAISRHMRGSTLVGCLTDRALRLRPHRSVRGGREISAFEHCGRITGNSDVTRLGKGCRRS
jgi:transcriptional regulator GlxA family with amidase domain